MRNDRTACTRLERIRSGLAMTLCSAVCCALVLACSSETRETSDTTGRVSGVEREAASATPAAESAPSFAEIFADEAIWPVRVWLEEPLQGEQGEVLVPARRLGVLIYLGENGETRVDFGRFGPHTVPASQTNLASEALRVRSGEATKTFPNLVGLIATRMVDPSSPELTVSAPPAGVMDDEHVLLVFADPFVADMRSIAEVVEQLGSRPSLRLTVLVPLGGRANQQIQAELRSKEWTEPFVLSALAGPYAAAMLEPDTELPLLRLCTANGRVLAEGPPSQETIERMRAVLMQAGG